MKMVELKGRREFLKYLGAGVLGGAIGYAARDIAQYAGLMKPLTRTVTQTATERITETFTQTQTTSSVTSVEMKTSSVYRPDIEFKYVSFFDYNLSGALDRYEPKTGLLPNTKVVLKDTASDKRFTGFTDEQGKYDFDKIPAGRYMLYQSPECKYPEKDFRYWTDSEGNTHELRENGGSIIHNSPLKGYEIELMNDREFTSGISIGPFTLPFKRRTIWKWISHFDVSRRVWNVNALGVDYKGGHNSYAGHVGTDFIVPVGTEVLACAPGIVFQAKKEEELDLSLYPNASPGSFIIIKHNINAPFQRPGPWYAIDYLTTHYAHLSEILVKEGDIVKRGDLIAYSGKSGGIFIKGKLVPTVPHLHLGLVFGVGIMSSDCLDFYRNVNDPKSLCFWSKDNAPQFPF